MEKFALKIGGVVFILIAVMHTLRVVMMLPVTIGRVSVPLKVSVLLGVIALALGVWMLKIACCCCKK